MRSPAKRQGRPLLCDLARSNIAIQGPSLRSRRPPSSSCEFPTHDILMSRARGRMCGIYPWAAARGGVLRSSARRMHAQRRRNLRKAPLRGAGSGRTPSHSTRRMQ